MRYQTKQTIKTKSKASSTNFSTSKVRFKSGNEICVGYLYTPANRQDLPCIVMANGFSGTLDWNLPVFAEKFAAVGVAVLIFDYRYFGESGGKPRQLINIESQREDIKNAINFVKHQENIDPKRIGLWGTSLGGGHVIAVAAEDPTIAVVIAQVPGIDMVSSEARATIKISTKTIVKILSAAVLDRISALFGLPPYYIKIFGKPGEAAVFTDPKLKPRIEAMIKSGSTWENRFTPRFYLALPRYKSGTAEKIKVPLLICIANKEVYGNPKFQEWVAKQAPYGEVKHYEAEHFDFYHGEIFEKVVKDQIAFLQAHLFGK